MKKHFLLVVALLAFFGCNDTAVEKPDNLIEEDKMVDIIYDLSVLDAIRSTNPALLNDKNIIAHEYIYTKYQIDSLQFAKSNQYYASDVDNYHKLYQRISQRLENRKAEIDTLIAKDTVPAVKKPRDTVLKQRADSIAAKRKLLMGNQTSVR